MVKVIINIKNGTVAAVLSTEEIEYYIKDEDGVNPEEWLIPWSSDRVSEDIVDELKAEVESKIQKGKDLNVHYREM